METISLRVNGITVTAPKGSTILEAARLTHIEIPTLYFLKKTNEIGAYRIRIVELENGKLVTSCVYPAKEGMEVCTNTPKVLGSRKKILQPLLSNHNRSCLSCVRSRHCELQELARELGVDDERYCDGEITPFEINTFTAHMICDNSKCIPCCRCVAVCENVQGIGVIRVNNRGFFTSIGSASEMSLGETSCVPYGQCTVVCSTGVSTEKDHTADVFVAAADPKKHVVVQTTPVVRAGPGEELGLPIGTDVEGKTAAALRRLGLDKVFDTNLSADLTIMEEAYELINRVWNGDVLPLITSCSPDRAKYYEHYFPDMTENLSSYKFPQQMFGAIAKSYYAERAGIDPRDIIGVSVMPCIAKEFETGHEDGDANGMSDIDISITTKEPARVIKKVSIRFLDLLGEEFDTPLDLGTGTAVTFDVMGGVMEAALRTAVGALIGEELPKPNFAEIHGTKGIKEVTYSAAGMEIGIVVASGLGNVRELLNKVRSGEANCHFTEIMRCPGGCINGDGQPQQPGHVRDAMGIRGLRTKVLYDVNTANPIRKSHENPAIKELYATYLGESGSEKAHHLLHTTYVKRGINQH